MVPFAHPVPFVLGFFVSSLINSRDARAGCGVVEGAPGAQAEKQAEFFRRLRLDPGVIVAKQEDPVLALSL